MLLIGCSQAAEPDQPATTGREATRDGTLCPAAWTAPGTPPPPEDVGDGIFASDIDETVDFDDDRVLEYVNEQVSVADQEASGIEVSQEERYGTQALRGTIILKISDDCDEGSEWWLRLDDPVRYEYRISRPTGGVWYYGWAAWSDTTNEWVTTHYGRGEGGPDDPGTFNAITRYVDNAEIWQRASMTGPPELVSAAAEPGPIPRSAPVSFEYYRGSNGQSVTSTPRAAFHKDRTEATEGLVAQFQTNRKVFPDTIVP